MRSAARSPSGSAVWIETGLLFRQLSTAFFNVFDEIIHRLDKEFLLVILKLAVL